MIDRGPMSEEEAREDLAAVKEEYGIADAPAVAPAAPVGGIVFTEVTEQARATEAVPVSAVEASVPTGAPARAQKKATPPKTDPSLREEFSLPPSFQAEPAPPRPAEEERRKEWRMYVPTFTAASDPYAMSERISGKTARAQESVASQGTDATVDPTAEEEKTASVDAVVVKVQGDAPAEAPLVNVIKPQPTPKPTVAEDPEVAELRSMEELLRTYVTPAAKAEEQTPAAVEAPAAEERIVSVHDIPDPEEEEALYIPPAPPKAEGARLPAKAQHTVPDIGRRTPSEYTAYAQRMPFKDRFLDKLSSIKVRLGVASVLTLVLLVAEILSAFGINVMEALHLSTFPWALALIDLQMVLCLLLLCLPECARAFSALLHGRVEGALLLCVSFLVDGVYTLGVLLLGVPSYPLFGFAFGVMALFVLLASHLSVGAEFMSFKLVSLGGTKRVLTKRLTRTLERENLVLDGLVDEYKSETATIQKTTFVSDFFARSKKNAEDHKLNLFALLASLGLALVGSVVSFFLVGGWLYGLGAFGLIYFFTLPLTGLLSHALPTYLASRCALRENSAAVGESSFYDYAGVDVLALQDTDIFGTEDVVLKQTMTFGPMDLLSKALSQMCGLFATVGGPLYPIFSATITKRPLPAVHVNIESDGLCGEVEGTPVHAGSIAYMLRHGIYIPEEPASQKAGETATCRPLYVAENGKVYAKFLLRYSFSEEFTMTLPALRGEGVVILVYTGDPCICDEMVRSLTVGEDCMRVMKCAAVGAEEEQVADSVSAGIVTHGERADAIGALLLSKEYVKFQKHLVPFLGAAMAAGAVASVMLTLFNITLLPAVLSGLWHGGWAGALLLLCRRAFPSKSSDQSN